MSQNDYIEMIKKQVMAVRFNAALAEKSGSKAFAVNLNNSATVLDAAINNLQESLKQQGCESAFEDETPVVVEVHIYRPQTVNVMNVKQQ